MTVVVRAARPDEHEAVIAVWAAADEARRGGPPPEEVPDLLRRRFTDPAVWLLVAVDEEAVVGIAQGMPARTQDGKGRDIPGLCHLSLVFVLPERWGEGLGGRLVDAAADRARRLGCERIQLFTHEDNARAQDLYRRHGFEPDGVVKDDLWGEPVGRWSRSLVLG